MTAIDKRSLLRGAMGATIAASQIGNSPGAGLANDLPPPQPFLGASNFQRTAETVRDVLAPTVDPLHSLRMLLVNKARAEMELLEQQLDLKCESLARMKSVSDAYKRYMYEAYRREARVIGKRFELYTEAVFKADVL